jgi:hypothetical protein
MLEEFNNIFARIDAQYQINQFPKLKSLFKNAINNVSNLTNLLLRKSLLKENLYSYSNEYESAFYLPDEKDFLDKEKPRVMYDRLKAFMNALDYQVNNLPAFMTDLSDDYIKNTQKLLSYFSFHNFKTAKNNVNTKTLKEMIDKLLEEKDQILKRVLLDNLKLLEDIFIKIKRIIDDFIKYKKEKYNMLIRFKVFPFLKEDFTEELLQNNPNEYLIKLSKFMKQNSIKIPFIKEWIFQAIKLCYTIDSHNALMKIQKELLINIKSEKTKPGLYSPREKLLKIINYIAGVGSTLEKIYILLKQNISFIQERKKNFIEKILDIFKIAISRSLKKELFFKIEYINPIDKKIKNDVINVNEFLVSIKKKVILFNELLKTDSKIYEKIKLGKEDSLYKFIENTYYELILIKERTIGINGEIRLKVPKKDRNNLKELGGILDKLNEIITKSGEMRRKYVMEEEVILKKR